MGAVEENGKTVTNKTAYTYDVLGQLSQEITNAGFDDKGKVIGGNRYGYQYDGYGNIIKKGVCDENGDFTGSTVNYGYDGTWKDKLTSYNGKTITYDANGNPTNYMGTALVWEKGRQLKQFGNYTYKYNNDGIRIQKVEQGRTHDYILDGTNIVKEIITYSDGCNEEFEYLYDLDGTVCGLKHDTGAYYFYKNLQGDIVAITDDTGATVARYTYDAWGKCTIESDTSGVGIATINPFRYRSYYYDAETKLYYLQSRYYDPEVGRFINADDCRHLGINKRLSDYDLFLYCENIPVMATDSNGCFVAGVTAEAQAAYILGVFAMFNIFFDGKNLLLSYGIGGQLQVNGSASISVGVQVFPTLKNVSQTLGWGVSSSLAWSWGVYFSAGGALDLTNFVLGGTFSVGVGVSVFPLTFRINVGYTWKLRQYSLKQLAKIAVRSIIYFYVLGRKVVKMIKENPKSFMFEFLKTRYRFQVRV